MTPSGATEIRPVSALLLLNALCVWVHPFPLGMNNASDLSIVLTPSDELRMERTHFAGFLQRSHAGRASDDQHFRFEPERAEGGGGCAD